MAQAEKQGETCQDGKREAKREVSPGETETGWISARMYKNVQ